MTFCRFVCRLLRSVGRRGTDPASMRLGVLPEGTDEQELIPTDEGLYKDCLCLLMLDGQVD